MNRTGRYIIIAILVVVIALLLIFSNKKSDAPRENVAAEKIKIGVLLPLTGNAATPGEKLLQGVQLAAKEYGDNIELVIEDTHTKPTDAVTGAHKLLDVDNVDVIIGPYVPEETSAVAPIALEKGVVLFSGSYCSDSYKELVNVLCGYPSADKQLDTVIPEIKKNGVKTLALVNTNDDFGLSSRASMKEKAAAGGYTIALDELVPFGSRDLKVAADKVIASEADAIFIATGDTAQAFTLMKILHEREYDGTRITFIDVDAKYLREFGAAAEGTYAPGIAPSNFSEDYVKKFEAEYDKKAEDYLPALGYDILHYVVGTFETKGSKEVIPAAVAYDYKSPAIADFKYLPDRTVLFDMELWKAVSEEYVPAN